MPTSYENISGRFLREPPPFTVSRTIRTHPLWRYLWPYRSANHFALTISFAIAVWTLQGMFFPGHNPYSISPLSLLIILLATTVMIPYDELPAKVTITTKVPAQHFLDEIAQEMAENGYAVFDASASPRTGHLHFYPKDKAEYWPNIWIKQDVDVYLRDANTIDVYASKVDLSKLIHNLKRRYKKSRRAMA